MRRTELRAIVECGACGGEGVLSHRLRFEGAKTRYMQSFFCARCGAASEADSDTIPLDVEEALLARDGCWRLCVEARNGDLAGTVAALTEILGLERREAIVLAKQLPAVVSSAAGIQQQMFALADALAEHRIDCRVARCDPEPGAFLG